MAWLPGFLPSLCITCHPYSIQKNHFQMGKKWCCIPAFTIWQLPAVGIRYKLLVMPHNGSCSLASASSDCCLLLNMLTFLSSHGPSFYLLQGPWACRSHCPGCCSEFFSLAWHIRHPPNSDSGLDTDSFSNHTSFQLCPSCY